VVPGGGSPARATRHHPQETQRAPARDASPRTTPARLAIAATTQRGRRRRPCAGAAWPQLCSRSPPPATLHPRPRARRARHLDRAAPDPGRARARPRSWQHDGTAARSRANTYPAAVLARSRPELDDGHRGRAQPPRSWTLSPRPRVGPARSRRPPPPQALDSFSLASRSPVASRLFS
jgi:hypothetical protein